MKIEIVEQTVNVREYMEKYIHVEAFLEKCKECGNYNQVWSCPTFDFDPLDYWKEHDTLRIIGKKLFFDEHEKADWRTALDQATADFTKELYVEEGKTPGSVCLIAGDCHLCAEGQCTKKQGIPCRHPDKLRYSIEALGGDVGATANDLLDIELLWIKDGIVPDYFALIGGMLI
ncbi:putative metal-binding protein [Clostridiales Family XIII bacterium PM5-7]